MNANIKARTNGINCYGESKDLKILQEMFPLHPVDDDDILESLQKYFNSKDNQHVRFLQQVCFKSPLADVAKVYEQFREKYHPEIKPPLFSEFFDNDLFVELRQIQKWLDNQAQYPLPKFQNAQSLPIETSRQEIAQVLLSISEQFGYIPTLERFLLFYPNYLTKVLKVKNRYFQQQHVQGTCEVSNLSPKNCCFVGIIAAIEMGCPYMIARMVNMFLVRDGPLNWITDKKYPQQFRCLFMLFRKIAVAPWSVNQSDLSFGGTTWDKQVYFDLITAGMAVMSMSTICLAMGLVPDEPCRFVPFQQILEVRRKFNSEVFQSLPNKKELKQEIHQRINTKKNVDMSKEEVQEIQSKQVEPYMKEIGIRLSEQSLQRAFNKIFMFMEIPEFVPTNIKYKNNSFFHRYRESIDKGLQSQRKSDREDSRFECFINQCQQGSTMTFNNFGNNVTNTREFRKCIQVLTQNLCGYHNESFDYKKNIKLNLNISMPLKFYVRLLSISPMYINRQVLREVNHETGKKVIEFFDLGHLAIMVAESKAKLLMTSIQSQLFN